MSRQGIRSRGKVERDLKKCIELWENKKSYNKEELRSLANACYISVIRSMRGYENKLKNERWNSLIERANKCINDLFEYTKECMNERIS